MSTVNTIVATIEADHTIKLPSHLAIGEQVLVVQISSIDALLNDAGRRARFAETRKALQEAIRNSDAHQTPSHEDVVQLVKQARRTLKD